MLTFISGHQSLILPNHVLTFICQQLDPPEVDTQASLHCWPPNEDQVVEKTRALFPLLSDGSCSSIAAGEVDSQAHCECVHIQGLSLLTAQSGVCL